MNFPVVLRFDLDGVRRSAVLTFKGKFILAEKGIHF